LGTETIKVINLQASDNVDTLLEKISGIKNQKNTFASFEVEFWQSPINYKGYKMSKGKIMLFGVDPNEEIKLFHMEDAIFIKRNQSVFRLYFTDEYRQFEKVTDAGIISKLK
jgi:hypothetical protein